MRSWLGAGTAQTDNPSLDCRLPGLAGQSPWRVVLSGSGKLDRRLRLFAPDGVEKGATDDPLEARAGTLVMTGRAADERVVAELRRAGADVQLINDVAGQLWIPAVLEALVERGITRLLVEGGPSVWRAFDRAGVVDEVVMFRGGLGDETFDEVAASQMLARYVSQSPLMLQGRRRVGDDDMVVWQRVWGSAFGTSNVGQ